MLFRAFGLGAPPHAVYREAIRRKVNLLFTNSAIILRVSLNFQTNPENSRTLGWQRDC